jgi:hypothetical protein
MAAAMRVFTPVEMGVALGGAAVIEIAFFALLVFAGAARLEIAAREPPPPRETSIAVKPVIDDLPLLKLGGKRVRAKLPDMWKKQAPVKRFQEASAPSPDAAKTPEAIPSAPLVKPDAEAPPPDAAVAKEVDLVVDASSPVDPNIDTEGAADGVKQGTEADPLKARAVSLYTQKIMAWFNARFHPPAGEIPCEELKRLRARVAANVDQERRVSGYSISGPSGNAKFDAKVKSTMDGIVGQQLPPPPSNYPDVLGTVVRPMLSGQDACR